MDLSTINLRPFKLTDIDDFMTWISDDQVTRSTRWKTITSRDEALAFIKDVCIPHPWCRSICMDDRSIGVVLVFPASSDDSFRTIIGYAVAAGYWNKGVATKAVKLALCDVFKDYPDLIRLEAFVDVKNKGSQRVLEKAGFSKEGILRKYTCLKGQLLDTVVYSFLSTDLLVDSA